MRLSRKQNLLSGFFQRQGEDTLSLPPKGNVCQLAKEPLKSPPFHYGISELYQRKKTEKNRSILEIILKFLAKWKILEPNMFITTF